MLGLLPKTLNVGGTEYKIRSDYRDIFRIISAFNDPELTDQEKAYVCMAQVFIDFEKFRKNAFRPRMTRPFLSLNAISRRTNPVRH